MQREASVKLVNKHTKINKPYHFIRIELNLFTNLFILTTIFIKLDPVIHILLLQL